MKRTTKAMLVTVFFYCGLFFQNASARSGNAVMSGDWNDPMTWLFNGVHSVPANGDTIYIGSSYTVTVTSNVTYTGLPMVITVAGTLQFQTGKKLSLPCQSYVNILSGGHLLPGTGGGNSDYIAICGSIEWDASQGPLSGPYTVGTNLPITLASFSAKLIDGEDVEISWTTATEINNDYFLIEKSEDAFLYTILEKVKGAGNSTMSSNYSLIDKSPFIGTTYYRLSQVDYDGTRTNYTPCAVRKNGKNEMSFYPNPATTKNISLFFKGSREINSNLLVSDVTGKILISKDITIGPGPNKLDFSENLFPAGIYFLSIVCDEKINRQKIIIE